MLSKHMLRKVLEGTSKAIKKWESRLVKENYWR